jgi:hypothetical protein
MSKTIDFRQVRYVPIIKFHGIFDMQKFMRTLRTWIVNQGYEFHETGLKHKVPSPAGAEQEFAWWGWRKVNSYVKYHIDLYFHYWDLHDVEVVREGKKQKLQSAKLQLEITGRCELDWSNRFGGSRFLQNLMDFYNNYIVRKDIDTIFTDQLYYRLYKFQRLVKEHLEFETKTSAYEDVW